MVAIGRLPVERERDAPERSVGLDRHGDRRIPLEQDRLSDRHVERARHDRRRHHGGERRRGFVAERELRHPGARSDGQQVDDRPEIELLALEHPEDRERARALAARVPHRHAGRHDEDAEPKTERPSGRRIDRPGPAGRGRRKTSPREGHQGQGEGTKSEQPRERAHGQDPARRHGCPVGERRRARSAPSR